MPLSSTSTFSRLLLVTMGLLVFEYTSAPTAWAQESSAESAEGAEDAALPEVNLEKAGAEETLSYDELSAQAAQAYRAADYTEASALFQRAYALKPVPNLLYNIGRAEERSGNFETAVSFYEKFVTKPEVKLKAREEALERLRVLREVIALNAPAETDKPSQTQPEASTEDASSSAETQPPPPPLPAKPAAPRVESDYTVAWVTLSLAAASYITSGAFAWQAREAYSDFEDASSRQALRDAASWGQTSSVVADSTLALGAILTGVGVYFVLSPVEREVPAEPGQGQWTPQLGPGEIGLDWAIQF